MPIPMTSAQIIADLTKRIQAGEWPAGSQLPSYNQLAEQYGVSFALIGRVIAHLREAGIVVGVPGRGVYVAEK